jgi:hypothetical protein
VFGVTVGKLLGFLVSCRGIEANPEKIKTIEAMRPPARIKEVQKLTGCLAALSQFISRLAEQTLPFFKLLRKSGPFVWTDDAEEAFQELKRYLTSPPIVVAPEPGEPLLLYIAATAEAVSMVLVAERPEPLAAHEHGSSSASGSGSRDLRGGQKLGRQPGPSSRSSSRLTVAPGPSPRKPRRTLVARQSRGPELRRSLQVQ